MMVTRSIRRSQTEVSTDRATDAGSVGVPYPAAIGVGWANQTPNDRHVDWPEVVRRVDDRAWPGSGIVRDVARAKVAGGVVHELPSDLRAALVANPDALALWNDITPLGRNEFICWVDDAKQAVTRERRIRRTQEELAEGKRRPCCWPGCKHRVRNGKP
jgi:Bacteriocin-protection, YdeI or OmpD-Associated